MTSYQRRNSVGKLARKSRSINLEQLENRMMGQSVGLSECDTHTVNEAFQEKAILQKVLTTEQKTAFDPNYASQDH